MRKLIVLLFTLFGFLTHQAQAQDLFELRGKVFDDKTQEPVVDASVVVGNRGKQTDSLGRFAIMVKPGENLTISHVDLKTQRVKVSKTENDIVVYMLSDDAKSAMSDVVVVGFSKKSKLLSPAASTIITADDIKDVPTSNVADLLQGKVAGVNIQSTSGMPGARGSIFQRGLGTLNVSGEGNDAFLAPTQPLIIIDGVPIDPNTDYEYGFAQAGSGINPLTLIPAEDIEDIQILKDAAATAVYGSRGAYGVWIINTKKGRSGKPQINYVSNLFVSTVPKLREIYGGRIERATKIEQIINHNMYFSPTYGWAQVNQNYLLSDSLNPYLNNSTNWQDYFFKNRVNQNHNLSFSGGDPNFNYKINLGYYNEKGIIANTGFARYSVGMSTIYEPANKKIRLRANINANSSTTNKGSGVGLLQTGVATSGMASTILPPPDIYTENNAALAAFEIEDDNKANTVLSAVEIEVQIAKGLRFHTEGSHNFNTSNSNTFYPSWLNGGSGYGLSTGANAQSQYNTYSRIVNEYNNRNVLSYNTDLGKGTHNFSSYVFSDLAVNKSRTNYLLLYGAPNDMISGPIGYNLNVSRFGASSVPGDRRIFGYGGNVAYNYLSKYIMEFNYRIDGTSTNGPLSGYRHNPSVAVKWNFFKEQFLEQAKNWMDYASVRGSWGRSIVPQGTVFDIYGTYSPGGTYMGQPSVGLNFSRAPNALFIPNTSTTWNFGFDGSFFKGRFSLEYDTYYKTVENIGRDVIIVRESGYNAKPTNEVHMVNYGHELSLRFKPIQNKSFTWNLTINGAYNKNILTGLPNNARQLIVNPGDALGLPVLYRLGRSSLGNLLFNTAGVYSTYEDIPVDPLTGLRQKVNNVYLEAGDPKFSDLNGDYMINDNDRVAVGDPQPKLTGGIISTMTYKSWGLTINTSYTFFRDVLNTPLARRFQYFYSPNSTGIGSIQSLPPISEYDYWKQPGDQAMYPNPYAYQHNSQIGAYRYNQTLFQEDGSYFKFNSVTLSYALDKNFLARYKIKSVRVYFTGQNMLMLSNYSGPNPENVSDLGRDHPDGYPNPKKYSMGLNVSF